MSLSPILEHLLQSEKAHLYGKHWTLIYSIYTHIHIHVSRTISSYIFKNKNKNIKDCSVEFGCVELKEFKKGGSKHVINV